MIVQKSTKLSKIQKYRNVKTSLRYEKKSFTKWEEKEKTFNEIIAIIENTVQMVDAKITKIKRIKNS